MGGAASVGAAAGEATGGAAHPVVLNVYDLTPLNNYLHWCGLGIFHSAVEVHGSEYSFGAHDHPSSGVFEVEPKSCPGFIYRCSVLIGHTSLNPLEFREFIQRMASEYHGDTYHLISKNCNHFTDDLSIRLTGKPIPGWVNRLARLGAFSNCLLPESMRLESTETKHIADCRFSDGSNTSSNDNFDEDDLEDRHLLPTSSVGQDSIVKEVHR
ncbi:deSI-like protein At4g17486 [Phragmites australis]|uniref:deSI-like protein At4g17486 n=1 Tax=Phragmites australis TaxID=29695 RepID=UPI002D781415|nr:deSI-like protein At4g17486 [Phragmites australis]